MLDFNVIPPSLFTFAPVAAVILVLLIFMLMISIKLGTGQVVMIVLLLGFIISILSFLLSRLLRELKGQATQARGAKLVADRMQAMMGVMPGGYCLFTTQGLLRETVRVQEILGVEAINHFDDIVAALDQAPDFVEAFRGLQQKGVSFSVQVLRMQDRHPMTITGRRFRIGRDGPAVDSLWFHPHDTKPSAASETQDSSTWFTPTATVVPTTIEALKAWLDSLPFPAWIRGKNLELIGVNQAYAAALDMTRETVMAEQAELVSQTSAQSGNGRSIAAKARSLAKAETVRRHVIIQGHRRLMAITERPMDEAAHLPFDLFGFALDVTAEEEKDNELIRLKTAEQEVLENLGSAIAVYGPDMRLEFFNRAYQRLWGAEESFLNSKPGFGDILEDLRARRKAPEQADFQRYKKERTALFTSLLEPREDLMHLPDGTSLRILAIPHPMGGIMFVHEDVTDKFALESSYNTLIAVQRETLDHLAEGIAVFGQDGKIQLYNPAFARIWGLEHPYLDGNPHISELMEHMKPLFAYGNNWSEFKAEMVQYTLDRNPRRGQFERADSAVINYSSVPLPDGAVLNSYLDVTDTIKVEQALRASNAALAEADRLKSEFVANVSHQLRTPLNTIMGFAEILTNQYFGTLNEKQTEYTRTIMDASRKLLLLINDVLDLATVEAGRVQLEKRPMKIHEVMNAVKMMATEWARQQSIELIVDCPGQLEPMMADEQRVKQILFNLVTNAVKYTPAGGRVTLEAKQSSQTTTLSVTDTGVGILPEDQERVFGKFERTNTRIRRGGAGLGLALVKSFVELHGGRVELESTPNKGTRISCLFPRES